MQINSKFPHLGESIFTTINQYVQRHQPINLAQGFPGFSPDQKLIDELAKVQHKSQHQYAPLAGIFPLRERISSKMESAFGRFYHPEHEILVTAGAAQAIFIIITTFIEKDDEVIVFTPAFDIYEPIIRLQGGKPVLIEMQAPDYQLDWEAVKQQVSTKTKMILINTPHNPTGRMWTKEDFAQLEKITAGTNILILSDEVYEHIVFDGRKHLSPAQFPKLAARSLITYSFGKTFHITGWKTGYCAAPEELLKEVKKVHQLNIYCVNHPAQVAINAYLQHPEHYLSLPEFFQEKRDFFIDMIRDSRFVFTPAQGTYYQVMSYKNISDERDTDYAVRLIREKGLAAIPLSPFAKNNKDDKMLRFCFAKEKDTLKKAAEIINSL